MPFCTTCGTSIDAAALFCQNCGAPQPKTSPSSTHPFALPPAQDFLDGLSDRTASILCYIPVFGIIPAIVFLAAHKYRTNARVRFDAFQSLYLFVAWLLVSSAVPTLFSSMFGVFAVEQVLLGLLKVSIFVIWIYLLIKAASEQVVRLPVIGDLAARSAAEQT